jgi:hypothetical protein
MIPGRPLDNLPHKLIQHETPIGSIEHISCIERLPVAYMVSARPQERHSAPSRLTGVDRTVMLRYVRAEPRCLVNISHGDFVCFETMNAFTRLVGKCGTHMMRKLALGTVMVRTANAETWMIVNDFASTSDYPKETQ